MLCDCIFTLILTFTPSLKHPPHQLLLFSTSTFTTPPLVIEFVFHIFILQSTGSPSSQGFYCYCFGIRKTLHLSGRKPLSVSGFSKSLPGYFSIPIVQNFCTNFTPGHFYRILGVLIMSSENSHRYSMPASRSRNGPYETGLDGTNVTRFLFGDDESGAMSQGPSADERFPTLVRRDDQIVSKAFLESSSLSFCIAHFQVLYGERSPLRTARGERASLLHRWRELVFLSAANSCQASQRFDSPLSCASAEVG